ncbi:MAG: GerMN domain-containing protein [Acidimicrobiia bacterium]|nr:GerMN domain-containing protein [Acidimicrobiia bacterium]
MSGRHLTIVLLAATSAVVAACGIESDSGPRAVPEDQLVEADLVVSGDAAVGTSRVYLLAPSDPDEPPRLRAVQRDVSNDANELLGSLFLGPNTDEQEQQLGTALPREIELISTRTVGRVLTIDVTDVFGELTTGALRLAIGQIVITAGEIEGVDAVRVRVDGVTQVWPAGDGELTELPLTAYDYPGLVESTQPSLPAIPSVEA